MGRTVAIMQPYFVPYAGYFRLIARSDLFVVYDCVQFPRRGWVHRNKLRDSAGEARWLTLPLKPAPREALIRELEFPDDAAAELEARLRPFAVQPRAAAAPDVVERLLEVGGRPADYITGLLETVSRRLGLPWNVIRSSSLDLPAELRGQDRILEICRRMGATRYLNAPGGRDLYDQAAFAASGVELQFLPPFDGPMASILQRLLEEPHDKIRAEL